MKYRSRGVVMSVVGLCGAVTIGGTALADTTSASNGAGTASATAQISQQEKASNPQAVMFKDNGSVIHATENSQVTSAGKLAMRKTLPAWMGESGVVLDQGRKDGLYKPGEVSYMKDASPYVVVSILMPGASVFQSPRQAINNPTLVLPAGRAVTFKVMNLSNGYPGTFTVVRDAPPYPTFVVAKEENTVFNTGWISRSPLSGAYATYKTVTYTFNKPGKYYYLSMQPGNARGGQWGEILVKSPNGGA